MGAVFSDLSRFHRISWHLILLEAKGAKCHIFIFSQDPRGVNQGLLHILCSISIKKVKFIEKVSPVHIYCQPITDLTNWSLNMETHVKTAKMVTDTQSNYSHVQKIYSSIHGFDCRDSASNLHFLSSFPCPVWEQFNITNIIIKNGSNWYYFVLRCSVVSSVWTLIQWHTHLIKKQSNADRKERFSSDGKLICCLQHYIYT